MRAILFLALALVFLLSVDAAVEENKCAPTYTTADFPCTIPDGSDADDIANQQFVTGQNDVQARAMDMTSVRVAEFVKAKVNKDLVAQVKTDRAIDNKQWLRLKRVAAMAQITTNFFPISNKDKSDVLASMKTKGRVLNFFETGLSSAAGGDPGFTSRNQLESYLFCYPIFKNGEEIANKLAPFMAKKGGPACEGRARPKYAALNVYGYTLGAAPNYGTMAAVLDVGCKGGGGREFGSAGIDLPSEPLLTFSLLSSLLPPLLSRLSFISHTHAHVSPSLASLASFPTDPGQLHYRHGPGHVRHQGRQPSRHLAAH